MKCGLCQQEIPKEKRLNKKYCSNECMLRAHKRMRKAGHKMFGNWPLSYDIPKKGEVEDMKSDTIAFKDDTFVAPDINHKIKRYFCDN